MPADQVETLKSALFMLRDNKITQLHNQLTKVKNHYHSSITSLTKITKIINSLNNHQLFQTLQAFQKYETQLNITISDAQFRSILKFFNHAKFLTVKIDIESFVEHPNMIDQILYGVLFYLKKKIPKEGLCEYILTDSKAILCHEENLGSVYGLLNKYFSEEDCQVLSDFVNLIDRIPESLNEEPVFSFVFDQLHEFRENFKNILQLIKRFGQLCKDENVFEIDIKVPVIDE